MRGIIGYGSYVPWWRLSRESIAAATGSGAGKGSRSVASYDEDTTSMGVAAARASLSPLGDGARSLPEQLWFATTTPSYADKTNASAIHAALRLDRDVPAFDAMGAVRSANGIMHAALRGSGTTLAVMADSRTGLPGSPDERDGGDAAAAFLIGDGDPNAPVMAELLATASMTEEFVDRWRVPGDVRSRTWEERFGETRYLPLGNEAWKLALDRADIEPERISTVIVSGLHGRAVKQVAKAISPGTGGLADDLMAVVGNSGAAQAGLALANVLDGAEPGSVIVVVSLADGADVFVWRTTDAIVEHRPERTVAAQVAAGNDSLAYLKFLSWKNMVTLQPPNRPEPSRTSSSAAARNEGWKYGFVGSKDPSGNAHLPPARVSYRDASVDSMSPLPLADATGTIVTFTVDRLAYSPSPPIVFAVVDFDGDVTARLPIEVTDVVADEVQIGDRVEMTFRRLNEADGIQNYFWKAKPLR